VTAGLVGGAAVVMAVGFPESVTSTMVAGYLLVKLAWRIYLVRAWRRRGRQRAGRQSAT
jgi:hypothetical protein